MQIKSWRGYEFDDDGTDNGIPFDQGRDQWNPIVATVQRRDNPGRIVGVSFSERSITTLFQNRTLPFLTWLATLTKNLNPLDTSEGTLVLEMDDATLWTCQAVVSRPNGYTDNKDVAWASVTWITTDPLWHADTVTTETDVVTAVAITNPTFATNTTGWTKSADPANVTSAFSRDAAVYYDAAGSGKLVVSANTGAGGYVYVMNDQEIPVEPGEVVSVKCAVRTTNGVGLGTGIDANPHIIFYDAADAPLVGIGTGGNWIAGQNDNTWEPHHVYELTAPANTDYCKIGASIGINAAETGTVYFDAFQFVTGPYTPDPFTVSGNAPTHLTVKATPSGNFPQAIMARTFTVTNNGTRAVVNHPFRVDLEDNSASTINGTYWALLRDGKPQPCEITDYDTVQAYLWMVIDYLPAGGSIDYTLLVSDQTVLPGVDYMFNSYTAPAFDIGSAYVTTTSGSSATVTNIPSGLGSEVDRWIGGYMTILSGAQAGTTIELTDSSATTVTHAALGGGALASGVSVAIFMSSNERWVYPVRKTERTNRQRGLWYLSSGQKQPNDYRENVPGSWHLESYYNNDDIYSQHWFTAYDTGGGDDYFSIFRTQRRWEGGRNLRNRNGFDGVAIFTPVEITAARFDYQWKNPNSMCAFVAGSRQENGATEWTHEFTDATSSTTLANEAIQNVTLEADSYGFGLFVIPNGTDEIGEAWAGDNGTATSATATTLTDANKEWIADQYIGGTVRIVSGTGAGASVAITDNTSTVLTVASWPSGTPDSTSRYVIRNKDYLAEGQNHTYLHLTLDSSTIAVSAVSAETPAFVLYRDIVLNTDDGLGNLTEIQRIAIAPETTGRYIVLLADESLVVDGETMQAWVADTATDDLVRVVPPQAFAVMEGDRAALHWLRVNPGLHAITMAADETGVACSVDVSYVGAQYA
jgi:hypothetical protein